MRTYDNKGDSLIDVNALFPEPLSKQQVFNRVTAHLLIQGKAAMAAVDDGSLECAYRTPEGLKCAIGALIPDEIYSPKMENTSAAGLCDEFPCVGNLFEPKIGNFLNGIQRVHDKYEPYEWADQLILLAQEHDLNTNVVQNCLLFELGA